VIIQQLRQLVHGTEDININSEINIINKTTTTEDVMLSGALSLGLCYINRIVKENQHIRPRILVIQASPDTSAQYIPIMNCIFSAQRQGILLDSVVLSSDDSTFLQQASHLTGGIYLKPMHQNGLLQYLLSCLLADPYARKYLNLPTQSKVDYRASCFCHKRVIDIGFVCSVCLSIFCTLSPKCSTCGAKYWIRIHTFGEEGPFNPTT